MKPDIGGLAIDAIIRFIGVVGVAGPQFLGDILGQRFGLLARLLAEMQQAGGHEVELRQPGQVRTTLRVVKPMSYCRNRLAARRCGPIIARSSSPAPAC